MGGGQGEGGRVKEAGGRRQGEGGREKARQGKRWMGKSWKGGRKGNETVQDDGVECVSVVSMVVQKNMDFRKSVGLIFL